METAAPIILGISVIIAFLILCWISIAAWHDEILNFIAKIKPFNAKVMHKRNLKITKNLLKHNINNERNNIKTRILNNTNYCYARIVYKENIDWLEKKGFKVEPDIISNKKHFYRISW